MGNTTTATAIATQVIGVLMPYIISGISGLIVILGGVITHIVQHNQTIQAATTVVQNPQPK